MDYNQLIDLILDNIKKIVFPEEWLEIDLTLSKQEIFAILLAERQGEIIMSRIADYINVSMSTATGIIDRLVKGGYMERERRDSDRRIVVIRLTAKGRELVDKIKSKGSEYIKMVSEVLTDEEQQQLVTVFTKIMRRLEENSLNVKENPAEENKIKKIEIE